MTTPSSQNGVADDLPSRGAHRATSMQFADLKAEVLRALNEGDFGDARVHDGRVIAVKTTPLRNNASAIVVGTAALPAGYQTPAHHHAAEEVAVILSGSGSVEIDGELFPVREGTVLVTPADSTHITSADESGPLVVLWFYAPPGSEGRWIRD